MLSEKQEQNQKPEIPPICLKSTIAQRLKEKRNFQWAAITEHQFTVTGISSADDPTNPLLKVRSNDQTAVEREILLSCVKSANGIPLPTADQLVSAFA